MPTRGQAIATRSCTPPLRPASYAINGTSQYWFQRPLAVGEKVPLCVVGGARREAKPGLELYVSDDATVNAAVGAKLRDTLPSVFPEKFDAKVQPEIEWVSALLVCLCDCKLKNAVVEWYYGIHGLRRPICDSVFPPSEP